jgi:hypothetical protein
VKLCLLNSLEIFEFIDFIYNKIIIQFLNSDFKSKIIKSKPYRRAFDILVTTFIQTIFYNRYFICSTGLVVKFQLRNGSIIVESKLGVFNVKSNHGYKGIIGSIISSGKKLQTTIVAAA